MTDFFYLKKYLQEHKYYQFEEKILFELESHPDYPSLVAIVDVFNYYDIENIAARIDESELINFPETFLSVFCTHTGNEIVYTKKREQNFEIQFANGFIQKLSRTEYLEGWNGMIVAIEENENNEIENNIFSQNIRLFLFGICIIALFQIYSINLPNPVLSISYALTSFAGLFISVFLVREDLGFNDLSVSRICQASKKTSCKEVLSSNGAKIFGNLKLSDTSLIYFSVLTVFSVFTIFTNSFVIYSWLTLFSIPVLFYSIFTQYFIVKKWCILCLGIAIVLILQILLISIYGFNTAILSWTALKKVVPFLFVFILVSFIFLEIKRLVKQGLVNKSIEVKYNQIKRKYPVFKALSDTDESINQYTLEEMEAIVIGQDNAPIELNAVISASCIHCHKVYQNLIKLWNKNPEQLKIRLVFNINAENVNNPYNVIYKQAVSYYLSGDQDKVMALLHDWHIQRMDFEKWKSRWINDKSEIGTEIIQHQYHWCLENKIFHTPAIILNGQLMPNEYEVHELNFFIDNLIKEKTPVL